VRINSIFGVYVARANLALLDLLGFRLPHLLDVPMFFFVAVA